ncbi:uncharacterized protein LOC108627659 [Ceratina calcarata]|uniref:Uncharacterized protein LOC108627659 n=1 Tax=Ceratina calcarata TaxID=156304 RepID=A0AAJ7J4F6_9HYME|nr:uncharacterized protein LOC108627659 [Ceratina calcarata]
MFESNDWDLDQDLLNDVDAKAFDYYYQLDDQNTATKKRKLDTDGSSACLPNTDSLETGAVDKGKDKQSRKNLILKLFNKNSSDKNVSQGASTKPTTSCDDPSNQTNIKSIQDCESTQLPRKKLILNILQKNNSRSQEITEPNHTEKLRSKTVVSDRENNATLKNDVFKSPQKKMTLIRKFPGPAGLLPDDMDHNVACFSYLKSLEESEAREDKTSTKLPEYCSQNTTNLFTEGAWQLMLNDLPDSFLNGYDIASVKQKAALNSRGDIKVKFLAGIVEQIDYNYENPPIVLKDFSDSIRGIVHKDISLKYPGLLESNVVLLLRDVGLLKIPGISTANKYQILISPSSLLAIYARSGTVERTEHMESIFGGSVDRRKAQGRTFASDTNTQNASHDKKLNKFDDDDTDIPIDLGSDLSFQFLSEITDLRNDFDASISKIVTEKPKKKEDLGGSLGEKKNLSSDDKGRTKVEDLSGGSKPSVCNPDENENVLGNCETAKTKKASEKRLTDVDSDDELLSQMDIDF